MKAPQVIKTDYMFTTNISSPCQDDDFFIEFSPLSSDLENNNEPSLLIRNFDELIDFFEEHFEE